MKTRLLAVLCSAALLLGAGVAFADVPTLTLLDTYTDSGGTIRCIYGQNQHFAGTISNPPNGDIDDQWFQTSSLTRAKKNIYCVSLDQPSQANKIRNVRRLQWKTTVPTDSTWRTINDATTGAPCIVWDYNIAGSSDAIGGDWSLGEGDGRYCILNEDDGIWHYQDDLVVRIRVAHQRYIDGIWENVSGLTYTSTEVWDGTD